MNYNYRQRVCEPVHIWSLGCPDKGATKMECKMGYEGPLCALCQAGFFKSIRECIPCENPRIAAVAGFFAATVFVAAVLFIFIRKYRRYLQRASAFARECTFFIAYHRSASTLPTPWHSLRSEGDHLVYDSCCHHRYAVWCHLAIVSGTTHLPHNN